jgi:sugar/nucleoside kinase (ribokinase family)
MELKPHFDIIVPETYFCDVIFTGFPSFPKLGEEVYTQNLTVVPGGCLNTVVGLRRMGVNVGWTGGIGDDFFSRFILDYTQSEGIDSSLLVHTGGDLKRVTVALSYPDDRAFVSYVDPSPDIVQLAHDALERADARHLHFTGLVIDERLPALIARWHERGIRVSMDCQHQAHTLSDPLLRVILTRLDLFTPNAEEARRLAGTDSVEAALDTLAVFSRDIVIKNGAHGAISRCDGIDYVAPALSLTPLDTTGAGDAFNAGFLAAYLEGHDRQTCLTWGNYCGGMSTQGYGGISTAPTRAQLDSWLAESEPPAQ